MQNMMDQIEHIKTSLLRYGRPLEIALYHYFFLDGEKENVIKALAAFQNEDGGFGHGLEPDFFNPNSSPMATWSASCVIRELDLSPDHPMIKGMLNYLENTYIADTKRWLNTIPSNNDYPHAPWWRYDDLPQLGFNPSASLAGFILRYAKPDTSLYRIGKEIASQALTFVQLQDKPIEMHEFRCILDLVNDLIYLGGLDILTPRIHDALNHQIDQLLNKNENEWFTSYTVKPTHLFSTPNAYGASKYIHYLQREIDLTLEYLDLDGYIPVTWSWGYDEENFKISKQAWQGIIHLNYLKMQKALIEKK